MTTSPSWTLLKRLLPHYAEELNRRVEVEAALFEAATGRRALPDAAECRRMAIRLGVPSWVPGKVPENFFNEPPTKS